MYAVRRWPRKGWIWLREWIQEKLGVAGTGAVCLVTLGALGYFLFRPDPMVTESNTRTFICAETGKSYEYRLQEGDRYPVESPHSGKKTGYPAERCYWTAEGKAKREPTYVLLNEFAGKDGPTTCPDCGRRVYRHNARPPEEKWAELTARGE